MQGTPGNDDFTLYPFMDPMPTFLDAEGGVDLLRLSLQFEMNVTLNFSTPDVPQTIVWLDGTRTTILNFEWIELDARENERGVHVTGGAYDDT